MKYLRSLRSVALTLANLGPRLRRLEDGLEEVRSRQTYLLVGELGRRSRQPASSPVDLCSSELRVFSQNGEDGIIESLVRAIGDVPPYFVEFGVEDGTECSTRLLAEFRGWSGLYIEPDAASFARVRDRYIHRNGVKAVNQVVTPANLSALLRQADVPARFGILSIDVDGQDYWIWRSLDARFRPDIVVIEYNAGYARDASVVEREGVPWDGKRSDSFGASIGALEQLGADMGYRLVHCDAAAINAFFVADDIASERQLQFTGITDRSPNYGLRGRGHGPDPKRPTVAAPGSL